MSQSGFGGSLGLQPSTNENYSTVIKTNIAIDMPEDKKLIYDYDMVVSTRVTFSIGIEARSWGIKGVFINVIEVEPFTVNVWEIETSDIVKTIPVKVDCSKLSKDTLSPTHHIGLGSLDINIDLEGRVNYQTSSIETFGF